MRKRKLLEALRHWWISRKKSVPDSAVRIVRTHAPKNERSHGIESLETRISPAMLVSSFIISYHDSDGDLVTVKSSKAIFTSLTVANAIFKFDTANVVAGSDTTPQQLQEINLSGLIDTQGSHIAAGDSLTISVVKNGGGDGFADIGFLNATGVSLGKISIAGDLGRINVGDGTKTLGLTSLTVNSLGVRNLTTQDAGDITSSLTSNIVGGMGTLTVATDIKDADVAVINGVATLPGKIGSVIINGSLLGGTATNSGALTASGNIGSVKVTGNITGSDGGNSGQLSSQGTITTLTVLGTITGGMGDNSGGVLATNITTAKVNGNIVGALGKSSGQVAALGKIGNVTVLGSLTGGAGENSGAIAASSDIGVAKIFGDITGGGGSSSGQIGAGGKIGSAMVLGSVVGGTGSSSGGIESSGALGIVSITHDVEGGVGNNSGQIGGTSLSTLTIGGKLIANELTGLLGGTGIFSGTVVVAGDTGTVKITGDVQGGVGANSGQINGGGKVTGITITNGNLTGGSGVNSGDIISVGALGTVGIAKNVQGGAGVNSGEILSSDTLHALTIGGSLLGGTADSSGLVSVATDIGAIKITHDVAGTVTQATGGIFAGGKIAGVTIGGALTGSDGINSGSIFSGLDPTIPGNLGTVVVTGNVTGGAGANSGEVQSGGSITSVTANSLRGGAGDFSGVVSAAGTIGLVKIKTDVQGAGGSGSGQISGNVIKSVSIGGNLLGGAGDNSGAILSNTIFGLNADIQGDIGTVTISGLTGMLGSTGDGSGQINAAGTLTSVTITHSLTAGTGAESGSIFSGTDSITSGKMNAVTIDGDVSGSIRSGDDIGTIVVKGNIAGTSANPVVISARGQAVQSAKIDLALKSLSVSGNVDFANILGGYDTNLNPVNPDAQIGTIKVVKNWTSSSVAAGVYDVNGDGFGNADDAKIIGTDNPNIVSKIASIAIGGTLAGTPASGDHFGFVAQEIDALKIGTMTIPLHSGLPLDVIDPLAPTDDTSLHEVAL